MPTKTTIRRAFTRTPRKPGFPGVVAVDRPSRDVQLTAADRERYLRTGSLGRRDSGKGGAK